MPTAAKTGAKTEFRRGDTGTPEIFTKVPEVTGRLEVGMERPEIDVSSFDSDLVERIGDMPDGMPIEVTMNYNGHVQQLALIQDVEDGVNRNYQIYNPGFLKTYTFILAPLGWVHGFEPKGKAQDLKFKARISNTIART